MSERFEFTGRYRNIVFGLIGVGIVLLLAGIFFSDQSGTAAHDAEHAAVVIEQGDVHPVADTHGHGHEAPTTGKRILANVLIGALYFMTITMGALFFLAIHRVGNAGWQTAIRRVPEAITSYLPVAVVSFAALFFFLDHLFEWAHLEPGVDALIDEKRAYLNEGGFIIRNLIFFGGWFGAAWYLRKLSLAQDQEGGLFHFKRAEVISAVFIIFFAISYSLFAIDWVKSLEPHWFSTIFGIYIFAGSMVSAMVTIYLILVFLKKQGYMSYVNDAHFHDIGKYVFGFSVFWAYIWVAQYLLIWYSNIPEEGIYYVKRYRVEDHAYLGYSFFFYFNVLVNFFVPFLALMTRNAKRTFSVFIPVGVILLYGHWHDLFLMVMPGAVGYNPGISLIEVGTFMTFLGLFLFVVFTALTRANLVPQKHPYLEESLHHTTGEV
ncbi:MAG: quinol:cytochrome C oxidoreductase [Bacteroidetes bacterium]|nr:MAG: quinol:cytochrome C oxidoreductase [Bacteroidota bacterium]